MPMGDAQKHCPALYEQRETTLFPCSFALRLLERISDQGETTAQRLESLERRIDRLDEKIGALDGRLSNRIDGLSHRIDSLQKWTIRMLYALTFGCAGLIVSIWIK